MSDDMVDMALIKETRFAPSQPAPQGVAELMALADSYRFSFFNNEAPLRQAITSIIQERDALKDQVEELGKELTCLPDMRGEMAWYRNRIAELEGRSGK